MIFSVSFQIVWRLNFFPTVDGRLRDAAIRRCKEARYGGGNGGMGGGDNFHGVDAVGLVKGATQLERM